MLQLDKAVLSSANASLACSACCDAAVLALIHTQVALPDKRADHLAVGAVQDAEDGQAVGGGLVADCAADRGCQLRGRCVAVVPLQQRAICVSDRLVHWRPPFWKVTTTKTIPFVHEAAAPTCSWPLPAPMSVDGTSTPGTWACLKCIAKRLGERMQHQMKCYPLSAQYSNRLICLNIKSSLAINRTSSAL